LASEAPRGLLRGSLWARFFTKSPGYDSSHTTTPLDFAVQGADTRLTGVEVQQQGDVVDSQGGGEGGRELDKATIVEFLALVRPPASALCSC
jgi:hypothetical protein